MWQMHLLPLMAILLITISETLPQVLQIFLGVLADFQHHRVLKYTIISFAKFLALLYRFFIAFRAVLFLVIRSIYLSD